MNLSRWFVLGMLALLTVCTAVIMASAAGSNSIQPANNTYPLTVTKSGLCYEINNMTQYSNVTLDLNGSSYYVLDNFISPLQVGISINNISYTLKGGTPIKFASGVQYNYTVELTAVSYKPYLHTASLAVCAVPRLNATTTVFTFTHTVINITNGTQQVIVSNLSVFSNVTVNYRPMNATFVLSSASYVPVSVLVKVANVTGYNITVPDGYGKLSLLNFSINSSSVPIAVSFHYRCAYVCNVNLTSGANATASHVSFYKVCPLVSSIIRPFLFSGGSWESVTPTVVDANACSLSFGLSNSTNYFLGIFNVPTPSVIPVTPLQQIATTIEVNPLEAAVIFVVAAIIITMSLRRSLSHSKRILDMNKRILKSAGSKIKRGA